MFTGIVEEVGRAAGAPEGELFIKAAVVLEGTKLGDSIAVNGTCLTVTRLETDGFAVDLAPETLRRTNLGALTAGAAVNLERSLAFGGRVGGHLVQGHVDGVAAIESIEPEGNASMVRFRLPGKLARYVTEKGFIAVDGVSLTVVGAGDDWFSITLIPFTGEHTNLGAKAAGDPVNIEVDILAKYVERLADARLR